MLNGVRWKIAQVRAQLDREWRARQRRNHPQAAILMYHRVAEKDVDPWHLCVTPENFEAHLQVIRQQAQPMSLEALAIAQQTGTVPDRAVAITFDDGYANNLHRAQPLLAKHNIPATVFVSTGYTERDREYWWDELEFLLLQVGQLPETLTLPVGDRRREWTLGAAAHYSLDKQLSDYAIAAWEAQPGSRLHFYYDVWAALQLLDEGDRQAALNAIAAWSGVPPKMRDTHRPMRRHEVLQLDATAEVAIGAHTVNHPLLSKRSLGDQQQEILASKAYLEQLLNRSINTFAYPFGAYRADTVPLVREADFSCACTTVEETIGRDSHAHELPRFEVRNWSGAEFEQRLQRWFSRGYVE